MKTFWALLSTDLKLFIPQIRGKAIDAIIWGTLTLSVMQFIFPALGLKNFGLFQAASVYVGVIMFETYGQMFLLAIDVENRRYLFFLFTLPINIRTIILQKVFFYTINGLILSLLMIPLSKLILQNSMDLTTICWSKLILSLVCTCLFFANFLIFLLSFVTKTRNITEHIEHMFMRIQFPMWFIGGFQFNWKTLFGINEYIGYIALLSPYTYAHEAARSAILGSEGFLPYWLCIAILLSASAACFFIGAAKLKKDLDLA